MTTVQKVRRQRFDHTAKVPGMVEVTYDVPPLRPLGDNLLLALAPLGESTPARILLPGHGGNEAVQRGVVLAVGPGRAVEHLAHPVPGAQYGYPAPGPAGSEPVRMSGVVPIAGVEVGDEVLFSGYSGTAFHFRGAKYLFVRAGDLIGVLNPGV